MSADGSTGPAPSTAAVAVTSGLVAGALLAVSTLVQATVFQLPAVLAFVIVPGVVCNGVLVATLVRLGRWGRDDRATVVRLLGAWVVICPLLPMLAIYVLRGVQGATDPLLGESLARLGASPWALGLHTRFMERAALQALAGVGCAAWLVVRASVRRGPA